MIAFLVDNWLWVGLIGLFIAMHRGGHGCGMHGGHGKHRKTEQSKSSEEPHDHSHV